MWRDRTNLYISYRQSYAHHPSKRRRFSLSGGGSGDQSNGFAAAAAGGGGSEETRGLISSSGAGYEDGDAVIEMDLLPPRWIDVQDEVGDMLKEITLKAAKLDKLHAKHVLPTFDDEHVKQAEEREIEDLTQEITRGFQECQRAIKRIDIMVKEARQRGGGGLSQGDEVMAANIQMALAVRVQEVSASFRKKQSNYLRKLRQLGGFDSPSPGFRSATPVLQSQSQSQTSYSSDLALLDSETDKSLSQATMRQTGQHQQQQHMALRQSNDTAIAQREREINDIAQGIIELADIFRDLQAMVIDQGTMLDRIDYNVERMTTDVKGAEKELVVATSHQRKNTKRKILLLLFLLVVAMFVLVLVKPKRGSSGTTGAGAGAGAGAGTDTGTAPVVDSPLSHGVDPPPGVDLPSGGEPPVSPPPPTPHLPP